MNTPNLAMGPFQGLQSQLKQGYANHPDMQAYHNPNPMMNYMHSPNIGQPQHQSIAEAAHQNGPTDNMRDFNYVQGGGFDENENYELYEAMDGAHGDSQSNERAQ